MRSLVSRVLAAARTAKATTPLALAAGRPLHPAPVIEPIDDPLLGDPAAHFVRAAMERGDWSPLADLLPRARDPDHRTFYVEHLADTANASWAAAFLRARPNSADAALMAGALAIHQAWRLRGAWALGDARAPSTEAREAFDDRLHLAEHMLLQAARLAPADPAPWALLMRASIGLNLGQAETARRFAEVKARAPRHRAAHSRMLQQYCRKWGGSHEKTFAFARSSSDLAPPGSPLHALVAEAHVEWWFDPDHTPDYACRPDPYFARREVRDELNSAAQRCFALHAAPPSLDHLRAHNVFALSFWLAGDLDRAREHLDATGNWMTAHPWGALGGVRAFRAARAGCGVAPVADRLAA